MMKISHAALWHLLRSEKPVALEGQRGKGNQVRISKVSVDEFMNEYVASGLITRQYGLKSATAEVALRQSGATRVGNSCWLKQEVEAARTALEEARDRVAKSHERRGMA